MDAREALRELRNYVGALPVSNHTLGVFDHVKTIESALTAREREVADVAEEMRTASDHVAVYSSQVKRWASRLAPKVGAKEKTAKPHYLKPMQGVAKNQKRSKHGRFKRGPHG